MADPINFKGKNKKSGLNTRQDVFCNYIAAGHSPPDAYLKAGYMGDSDPSAEGFREKVRRAAQSMLCRPGIQQRITLLLEEQHAQVRKERFDVAKRFRIDMEEMTKKLLEDRHLARTGLLDLDADPTTCKPDDKWKPDPRAAVQASMGLAKLHGLLIDRKQITVVDAMSNMNDTELLQFIAQLQAQIEESTLATIDLRPSVTESDVQDEDFGDGQDADGSY